MKIAKFILTVGNKPNQQTKEQKLKQGLEYVETLKKCEKVIEVQQTEKEIIIIMED